MWECVFIYYFFFLGGLFKFVLSFKINVKEKPLGWK